MAAHTYDVESRPIGEILKADRAAFRVPEFQRRYAWTPAEVGALLSDLFGDIDWAGDSAAEGYFLGSIVLAQAGDEQLVLDGQQRLTTIVLLLTVLHSELQRHQYKQAHKLEQLLFAGGLGEDDRVKVQLQPEDQHILERLLKNNGECEARDLRRSPLAAALRTIRTGIKDAIEDALGRGVAPVPALERMAKRLLYEVELVRILAPSEATAFRLFETLNDRGLPLNAADLIKNNLLARSGPKHLEATRDAWTDLVDMVGPENLVPYLRHYWIAFEGSVRKDTLYDVFKTKAQRCDAKDARVLVTRLRDIGQRYAAIARPSEASWPAALAATLDRLQKFGAKSCRPLLLLCAEANPDALPIVAQLCESATVRHSIIGGRNPNQLDKAYLHLCESVRRDPQSAPSLVAHDLTLLCPDDASFGAAVANYQVGSVTPATRVVLLRLNEVLSTGETTVRGPDEVHVEHILPRVPSHEALAESGLSEDAAQDQCCRLANLTLLHGRVNQSISNRPFSAKRPELKKSEIGLNRSVAANKVWGQREIERRAAELARLACIAWPLTVGA